MTIKRLPLFLVTATMFFLSAWAAGNTAARENSIKILREKLAKATTPKDSVPILYDLFDLSRGKESLSVGKELYGTASRAGDTGTQLDVLRLVTSFLREDKDFAELEKEARSLPPSQEQRETVLFLQMKRLSYSSKFLPEAERQKEIARLIAENDGIKTGDARERMLKLYTVVEYLRNEAKGPLLENYLNRLVDLANSTHFQLYAIPNIVYSEATNIYSDAGDQERAVAADRKLLDVIAGLEKKYAAQGREYRNYDRSRYICYRRMIRNSKGLAPGEAKVLHGKVLALVESDPDVKSDYEHFPRFQAYYNMAVGNYAEAIPYLKKFLASDKPGTSERRQLLGHLVNAAEKTGDSATKIEALTAYNAMLKEYEDLRAESNYKELQIKYDIMDLKERNAALELQASEQEIKSMKRTMTLELTACGLVIVVLVAFLFYWSKFQRNTYNMGKVVDSLAAERNTIRKSLYYDYADDPLGDPLGPESDHWRDRLKKKNKKDFEMSTFMTESIVNDLLYIAAVSATDRHKFLHDISADRLMREAITEAKDKTGKRDSFEGIYPEEDYRLETDVDCLRALIAHILGVASNYCKPGEKVGLTCLGIEKGKTRFAVTTPEKVFGGADDPRLFDLFINTEEILSHKGTGLFICRMIGLLVNCDFKSDPTWTGEGTRFILIVPNDHA